MVIGRQVAGWEVRAILEHGFQVLASHDLACFEFTLDFAKTLGCDTAGVQAYKTEVNPALVWKDWTLLWNGNAYKSPFESYEAWSVHYGER
jgi:hypothetical protein